MQRHESTTGVQNVPHPEPPSHLPPHPIPLGHPSAPAPSTLYHALNLDWRFISHKSTLFIYLFLNLFILIGGYLLYNIVLVLPYIDMNPPWVYVCSPS